MSYILSEIVSFLEKSQIKFDEIELSSTCFNTHFKKVFIGIVRTMAHQKRNPKMLDENDLSYFLQYDLNGKLLLLIKYKNEYQIVVYPNGYVPTDIKKTDSCDLYSDSKIVNMTVIQASLKRVREHIIKEIQSETKNITLKNTYELADIRTFDKVLNRLFQIEKGIYKETKSDTNNMFILSNECIRNILLFIMRTYSNSVSDLTPINVIYLLFKTQVKGVNFNIPDSINCNVTLPGYKMFFKLSDDKKFIELYEYNGSNKKLICKIEFSDEIYHNVGRKNYLLSILICMIRYGSLGDYINNYIGNYNIDDKRNIFIFHLPNHDGYKLFLYKKKELKYDELDFINLTSNDENNDYDDYSLENIYSIGEDSTGALEAILDDLLHEERDIRTDNDSPSIIDSSLSNCTFLVYRRTR